MSLVFVFAASAAEGQPVRKMATGELNSDSIAPFRCGPNEVVLITSGMGSRNARNKANLALGVSSDVPARRKPDVVLVIGLCGGLTASLEEGTIVAYKECLSTETPNSQRSCSPTVTNSVTALLASSNIRCERVVGITSSRIATRRNERLALAKHGASVVDMESYSILDAAAAAGVPGIVLRVVSDPIERELPDFNRALNDVGGLDGRKALKVALGSPLRTAKLLAANRRAMHSLTKALEVVLNATCFP